MAIYGNILWKDDLLKAEEEGLLNVKNRLDYGSCSLDVRIDKLFRERKIRTTTQEEDLAIGQEEFIEKRLEEIDFKDGFIPEPDQRYFWQPMEKLFLAKGFTGEITSRSSWARLGVHVQTEQMDDYFPQSSRDREWVPLCQLRTWTRVLLKPGDAIGHLLISSIERPLYIPNDYVAHLINKGELEIIKNGRRCLPEELEWHGHLVLTMGPDIKVYTGKVLIPGTTNEGAFEKMSIGMVKREKLPAGTFFISASNEYVRIPPEFAGYVTCGNSLMTLQYLARDIGFPPQGIHSGHYLIKRDKLMFQRMSQSPYKLSAFHSHPNAPYIWPRPIFEGRITFENLLVEPAELHLGMKQAEFYLIPFLTPCKDKNASRYTKQTSATESQLTTEDLTHKNRSST